jgi:hypothetical protein
MKWIVTGVLMFFASGLLGILWPLRMLGVLLILFGIVKLIASATGSTVKSSKLSSFAEGFKYSYWHDNTAVALDMDRRLVKLRSQFPSGTVEREYSFDQVRGVNSNIQKGGQITGGAYGSGLQGALNAGAAGAQIAGANHRIAKQNKLATGIFVTVKDIDHPRWRLAFTTEHDIHRWMENFEQAFEAPSQPL